MALYLVGLDSSLKRLQVWKTTGDPTTLTNWSAQDRGLTIGYTPPSISAVLNGTTIEIAFCYEGTDGVIGNAAVIKYARFDTSTDTWTAGPEQIDTSGSGVNATAADYFSCSIAARTSDIVIGYLDDFSSNQTSMEYARGNSGSWTTDQIVDDEVSLKAAGFIVKGASDRLHFFWHDDDADDINHRSLSSANVLDTEATVDAAVGASVRHPIGRGISYADNGNITVKVPYLDLDES